MSLESELIGQAWAAVSSDEAATAAPLSLHLEVTGSTGHLVSRFAVEQSAVACVGVALMAAASLHQQRGGAVDAVSLDRGHVAAAVRSERYFRRGGQSAGVGFAALSRFWRTSDGWVRTHANYPWHRRALLSVLGTSDDIDEVSAVMATARAEDIEERVFAAGGIAAAVRRVDAWRAHPQGHALAAEALIGHQTVGDAAPRTRRPGHLPASGMRVLDLTRVIAGPVCTRYLGALGADVLRIDPPDHLDMALGDVADTLLGKRSAMLDLRAKGGADTLHDLLERADVIVCGYRPGALDRFGLTEEALAERHPGVVVVYLDAWGHRGPWQGRRGFDSVVQGPTGIAWGESVDGSQPGALPCQLLDHGTGYLAAAAVLDGVRRQSDFGGTHIRRLSLARTAGWLTSTPREQPSATTTVPSENADSTQWLVELNSADGPVTAVAPPGTFDGHPLRWPRPLTRYGDDEPRWLDP